MNTNSGPLAGSIIEGRASSGLQADLAIVRAGSVAPALPSHVLRLRL